MPKKTITLEILEKVVDLFDHGYHGNQISKMLDLSASGECIADYTRAITKIRRGLPLKNREVSNKVIMSYAKKHDLPDPVFEEVKKPAEPEPVSLEEPTTEDDDDLQDLTQEDVAAAINHFDRNIIMANTKFIGDQLNRIADELEHFNQNYEKYLKGEFSDESDFD